MSLAIKFFCTLLVLGFAGLFVLKKPDGTPWLAVDDLLPNTTALQGDAKDLLNQVKQSAQTQDQPASDGIYRWQDADGRWQYSDKPPENITAESIQVSGHLNQDLSSAYKPAKVEQASKANTTQTNKSNAIMPSSLSPDDVSQLIKDANNIQGLMDDRQSQLDAQIK